MISPRRMVRRTDDGRGGRLRVLLKAPALSLSSQVVGMAQLGLLVLHVGANTATDAYLYLFNLGIIPIMGIIVGAMYPSMLSENRPRRRDIRIIRWATPFVSIVMVSVGAVWLHTNGRLEENLYPLAVLCGLNAVAQAQLWFRAVCAEAGGNAVMVAAIALPPNILATIALLLPWATPEQYVVAMAAGLLIGNLAFLLFMVARRTGEAELRSIPVDDGSRRGMSWFLGMATVEFVGQTVMQSLAVLLPPSSITILNVVIKVVSSTSTTFVNASMPLLVHAGTDSPREAKRFLRIVVTTLALGGIAIVGAAGIIRPDLTLTAVAVALWLIASGATAVVGRMSFRFLDPVAASIRPIVVFTVVVGLALLSSRSGNFDLTVLLCAYLAADGASAMLLLWPLKDRIMSAVLAVLLVAGATIWVTVLLVS